MHRQSFPVNACQSTKNPNVHFFLHHPLLNFSTLIAFFPLQSRLPSVPSTSPPCTCLQIPLFVTTLQIPSHDKQKQRARRSRSVSRGRELFISYRTRPGKWSKLRPPATTRSTATRGISLGRESVTVTYPNNWRASRASWWWSFTDDVKEVSEWVIGGFGSKKTRNQRRPPAGTKTKRWRNVSSSAKSGLGFKISRADKKIPLFLTKQFLLSYYGLKETRLQRQSNTNNFLITHLTNCSFQWVPKTISWRKEALASSRMKLIF